MRQTTVAALCLVLTAAACSARGPAAIVDGVPIERADLAALHDPAATVSDDQRASSLFLLILHRLVVAGALEDFGVTVTPGERDAAFAARTVGLGSDVDAVLAERGVTRARVMLEAELDVIRTRLEEEMVRSGWPGVDLDKAYRDFLAANARACLVVLTLADETLVGEVESRVAEGEGLEEIFADYPERTARLDLGCLSPLEHGAELAPVALDGEVGRSYARHPEAGGVYVALVTERHAPAADEVRDEVIEVAIERQGPDLFTRWAADLLSAADVDISDEIGSWGPGPETGDLPTVVVGPG